MLRKKWKKKEMYSVKILIPPKGGTKTEEGRKEAKQMAAAGLVEYS